MTRICHLFDASAGWEQRVGVSQLLDRLPKDKYVQSLASIDPAARRALTPLDRPINLLPRIGGINALAAPLVARFVRRRRIELLHAWGPQAAAVAATVGKPLVLELFDPVLATRHVKLVRTLTRSARLAIVCSCGWVRRRLIEGGVRRGSCVVVRPGVDFAIINKARAEPLRRRLGSVPGEFLTTVPDPITHRGGQIEAFWAATLLNHAGGCIRMILPGCTRARQRIARLALATPPPQTLLESDDSYPFEKLVAVADALIVAPQGDTSTTAVAWAMAAGTAVIGAAVPSVAELIAHRQNGLLYKPPTSGTCAVPIARLLQDRLSQEETRENARAQAYKAFSVSCSIDQHMRVYENILESRSPNTGVTDPAAPM